MFATKLLIGFSAVGLVALAACGDDDDELEAGNPDPANVKCADGNGGITLPDGFCATVFYDDAAGARQITVNPSGHVFVAVPPSSASATDGHVLALFDSDNDGVAEAHSTFGNIGGNGITWANGALYVAANDRVMRFVLPDGATTPESADAMLIASQLRSTGDHRAKTVVVANDKMYVNIGSPSNACQIENREVGSKGVNPCVELATGAGVWEFGANVTTGQASATRVATGVRNANALAIDPATGALWSASNGRDQLHENWPALFTEDQDKQLPSDEFAQISPGVDRGWPYCYHDAQAGAMKLAPEYMDNGAVPVDCAQIESPAVAIPAHSAPLAMVFTTGTQFPSDFRTGAFVSNHGTRFDTNATGDLHGYNVQFVPFKDGKPTGELVDFATGFDAGKRPLPDAAPHRPVGLAMMPDGSLLIGDDQGGRIWRVYYTGS